MPPSLPLPLRTYPGLQWYEFYVVAGTVLSDAVFSGGPGYYAPLGVHSKVRCYRTFRVRQDDGTEVELSADANQVQLREGHRVTLLVAGTKNADSVIWFWNHDAPQYSGVVQSTLQIFTFVPGDGWLDSFLLAFVAAKLVLVLTTILAGLIAGVAAGVPVFVIMIARSLRKRALRQRKVEARKAPLLEHLSRIGQALSLPTGDGEGAAPAHARYVDY